MTYAIISNSFVVNIIVVDNHNQLSQYPQPYDSAIEIDALPIIPGVGWIYDGSNFYSIICFPVTGGYPNNIPSGSDSTFDSFNLSDGSGGFSVSIDGSIIYVGCQSYDYAWLRYALWMLLIQGLSQVNCLSLTDTGVCCNNQFNILSDDINSIYSALINLI